jgi:hypothetical protein
MKRLSIAISLLLLTACTSSKSGINITKNVIHETHPTYSLDLVAPQVHGLADEAVTKSINDALQKIVDNQKKKFLADIEEFPAPSDGTLGSSLHMDYEVITANPTLLSIILRSTPYMAGAAHPNHISFSFLYDLESKKQMTLSDLFNTKSKYLDRLSQLSMKHLIDQSKKNGTYYEGKEKQIGQGAGVAPENFSTFSIDGENLILTFDPYQVGPYAEGEQQVTLSRAEITDVLSNKGRKILSLPAK